MGNYLLLEEVQMVARLVLGTRPVDQGSLLLVQTRAHHGISVQIQHVGHCEIRGYYLFLHDDHLIEFQTCEFLLLGIARRKTD